MQITFWGTRGSIPAPGPDTMRYGGNTSCVEVRLNDNTLIVFDAGTGIRPLGKSLLAQPGPRAGLPFSQPYALGSYSRLTVFCPSIR